MLALILALTTMTQAQAHQHFSLRGLRLGMTDSQAMLVLRTRHNRSRISTYKGPCVSDYLAQKANHQSIYKAAEHCVTEIDVPEGRYILEARFWENFPSNPGTAVITMIDLRDPRAPAVQNGAPDLREEATAQFGPPTTTQNLPSWATAVWCSQVCSNLRLHMNENSLNPTMLFAEKDGLWLEDTAYEQTLQNNARTYLAAHGVILPSGCKGIPPDSSS